MTNDMKALAERIAMIESVSFPEPWTAETVSDLLISGNGIYCTCGGEEVYGYALGGIAADEAELYRIAVLPEHRQKGGGQRLIAEFVSLCREKGVTKIFLEVRSRNAPAIALYEKCGFTALGTRKNYYKDDDAKIYCLLI